MRLLFLFSSSTKHIRCIKNIDEELAEFARHAIESGWVDAEPRENKPQVDFVLLFSEKESRISMRYDGSIDSVRILAHELGHAWHFII